MLPGSFHVPVAVLLLVAGLLALVAGYRLFRLVLAFYGFILGAIAAAALIDVTTTWAMIAVALGGGLVGALVFTLAYFAAVALLGGAAGVLFAQALWPEISSAPASLAILILFAAIGAVLGLVFQRYVIMLATAFGGAWTAVVGALALVGERGAQAVAEGSRVWILYPLRPGPGRLWILAGWFLLGLIGAAVQLGWTGRRKRRT